MVKQKAEVVPYPWACGFCGPGCDRPGGVCYDKNDRCPGAIGGVECACAAANHYQPVAQVETLQVARRVETVHLPPYKPPTGRKIETVKLASNEAI